jgi:hypothetical protein
MAKHRSVGSLTAASHIVTPSLVPLVRAMTSAEDRPLPPYSGVPAASGFLAAASAWRAPARMPGSA